MTVPADEPFGLRMALLTDPGRLAAARDPDEARFVRADLPALLDERFMLALRHAHPGVAARGERLLGDLRERPDRSLDHGQRQTLSTLLGYLWRAAFNPTPFGAFAGSGWIDELRTAPTACTALSATFRLRPASIAAGRPCLAPLDGTVASTAPAVGSGTVATPDASAREPADSGPSSPVEIVVGQPVSSAPSGFDEDFRRLTGGLGPVDSARSRLEVGLRVPAFEALPPEVCDTFRRLGAMRLRGDHHAAYLERLHQALAPCVCLRAGQAVAAPVLLKATRDVADDVAPDFEWRAELAAAGGDPRWIDPLGELADRLADACLQGLPVDGLALLEGFCEPAPGRTRLGGTFRRCTAGGREAWVLTRLTGRSASLLPRIGGGPALDAAAVERLSRWYGRWPQQADLCVPIRTEVDLRPRLTRVAVDCMETASASARSDGVVPWTALWLVPAADSWQLRDADGEPVEPVHLGVASRHLLPECAGWLLGLPTVPGNALEIILKAWNRAIGRALSRQSLPRLPELRLGPALIASPMMGVLTAADAAGASALGPARARQRLRAICDDRVGGCGLARVLAAGRFGQPRTIDLATPWGIDQLGRLLRRHPMVFVEPIEPAALPLTRGLELVGEFECADERPLGAGPAP